MFFGSGLPVGSVSVVAHETRRSTGPNQNAKFVAMVDSEASAIGKDGPFADFIRRPLTVKGVKRLLKAQGLSIAANAASSMESTLDDRAGLSRY